MGDRKSTGDETDRQPEASSAESGARNDRATTTGMGQEATMGKAEQHDKERQSQYGGGGANGGK